MPPHQVQFHPHNAALVLDVNPQALQQLRATKVKKQRRGTVSPAKPPSTVYAIRQDCSTFDQGSFRWSQDLHLERFLGAWWRPLITINITMVAKNHLDCAGSTPHGRWWDATFHTVTAVVGVGVLSLPYAFSYLTWTGGVIALATTTATSLYTAYLLAALHEEKDGRRCMQAAPPACQLPMHMHALLLNCWGEHAGKGAPSWTMYAQAQPVPGPGARAVRRAMGQLGHRALPVERPGRPRHYLHCHRRAEPAGAAALRPRLLPLRLLYVPWC